MTIPPGREVGEETHEDTDQILTFVSTGEADVAGQSRRVAEGDLVAPREHADGTVHATKQEADIAEVEDQDPPGRLTAADAVRSGLLSRPADTVPYGSGAPITRVAQAIQCRHPVGGPSGRPA